MEEKRLDAAESLELIGRMIRNTRQRLERHSGRPFLIWGYTTVGISLLNYAFNLTGADPNWSLSWFLIPVLGVVLMRLSPRKRAPSPAPRSTASSTPCGSSARWRSSRSS